MTNFNEQKVISGTFGSLYYNLDGVDVELANVKKFNCKAKATYEEFDNCNVMGKCRKLTGIEVEGEFTLNRVDYEISKVFVKQWSKHKNPVLRLVAESNDPDGENTRIVVTGVTVDEVAVLDFESKKLAEEAYSFKAKEVEYTE